MASYRVEGVAQLQRKLSQYPRAMKKWTRKAVNAGGTIPLQAGRRNAKEGPTKQLKKSIGRKGKTTKGGYINIIGPRRGFRTTLPGGKVYDPVNTAHLVEGGTKPHKITIRHRRGKTLATPQVIRHPGARAQPFMKPALENNRAAIQSKIAEKLKEGVIAEAKK